MTCLQCGSEIPTNLLACPNCSALIHAEELKSLAAKAEQAYAEGKFTDALTHWKRMLELLPAGTAQFTAIRTRVQDVSNNLDRLEASHAPAKPKWANKGGLIGTIGLLLWKFKFIALFILTKAKLLFLGLTKMSTLLSMLLYLGIYWSIWGWKFALGFVLLIYVHEMGHIYQLRRYGVPATAPMFIPGFGAMIRLKQYPATPHEEAVTGLAGPVWGLGATVVCLCLHYATGLEIFAALTHVGAWMNLFNLLPVWQLDGSHAMAALTRLERIGIAAIMFTMWFVTEDSWLVILGMVATIRCFTRDAAQKRDLPIFIEFAVLVVTLSLLMKVEVKVDRSKANTRNDSIAALQPDRQLGSQGP